MSAVSLYARPDISLPSLHLPSIGSDLARNLLRWWQARRTASRLHDLPVRLLRDVGIEPHEIEQVSALVAQRLVR